MSRPRNPQPKPVEIPDPLAALRDQPTEQPTGITIPTGTSLPPTDDGGPLEYLYAAESLPEAIAMALLMATPETMDAIGAELLVRATAPGAAAQPLALVTEDTQDEIRNRMIQVWHDDTVAAPILHKGGVCACRYIANRVLAVIVPALSPDETSDLRDDDPQAEV